MVTESDYGKPIFYIDGEELRDFRDSDSCEIRGYAFEWEGEGVTHLRFHRPVHAFGNQRAAIFIKEGTPVPEDASDAVIVSIGRDGASVGDVGVTEIPSRENLYSRSKGLLELDILRDRRVLIIGLGSGGSSIAVELAKAGVGNFAIADFDRVELHNLSRHVCTVNDLGRLKTDAIYDEIKGKNPYANVEKFPVDITKNPDLLREEVRKADVVMCCTDNNQSRFLLSDILIKEKKVCIMGRAITRAEGGDVFVYRPGGACYACIVGNGVYDQSAEEITDIRSARRSGRIAAYVAEEDAEAMVQVGLGADIEPINNMMVKLALVELSRGTDSGISSLEKEFDFNYYMWANRRERHYANWGSFLAGGNVPTIMRWYGVRLSRNEGCSLCGSRKLDLGIEYADEIKAMGGDTGLKGLSLDDI